MPVQAALTAFGALEGLSTAATFLAILGAGAIDAYILGALLAPDLPDSNLGSQNLVVRSAADSHKIIYGRTMVGGTAVLLDVFDKYYLTYKNIRGWDDNAGNYYNNSGVYEEREPKKFLNLAVALAAHEITAIEEVYIGEDLVFSTDRDTGELVLVDDKYKNNIEISYNLGDQTSYDGFIMANVDKHFDGGNASTSTNLSYYAPYGVTGFPFNTVQQITIDANATWPTIKHNIASGTYNFYKGPDGRDEPPEGRPWSTAHTLTNTAYIYFRFTYNPDLYKGGVPKVRCVIRGKKLYDPRKSSISGTDRGTWATNTTYNVGDIVTSPTSTKKYRCLTQHTTGSTAWSLQISSITLSPFYLDFIQKGYWEKVHSSTDPDTWEYSENWALATRDYLTSGNFYSRTDTANSLYGIGVKESEIDDNNIIEAANIADEVVYLESSAMSVVDGSYDATTKVKTVTVSGDQTTYYNKYESIEVISSSAVVYNKRTAEISNGVIGRLYNPLDPAYNTYTDVIRESWTSDAIFILSSTYDVASDITTITFNLDIDVSVSSIRLYSPRFTVNGLVDTERSPLNILEELLASGVSTLPYVKGKYLLIPGVYQVPTITIDDSVLAGKVDVSGSQGASNLVNTIKGTIKNPANDWEEADFPKQYSSTYIAEDGGYELAQNVKYSFVTSNFDAQRLARISLQRARFGVSATLECNLMALEVPVGSFIKANIDRLGWSDANGNNIFSVTGWSFTGDKVILDLRQESPLSYNWDSSLLTPVEFTPTSSLLTYPKLPAVTNLTAQSGTNTLSVSTDGTIVPRVLVSWDWNTVTEVEAVLELKVNRTFTSTSIIDTKVYTIPPDLKNFYIDNVTEGQVIDIYATVKHRDPNYTEATSPTVELIGHTVLGKSVPPSDVTDLSYSFENDKIVFTWSEISDLDADMYEIRYGGTDWASASLLGKIRGNILIADYYTIGTTTFRIKAIDTSGNYSINDTTVDIVIGPPVVNTVNTKILADRKSYSIEWAATAGSFAIGNYKITSSSGVIGTVSSDSNYYIGVVDWTGTETFSVYAEDVHGNLSSATTVDLTIVPPGTISLSSTIQDNNFVLSWEEPSIGSLGIDRYKISITYPNGSSAVLSSVSALTYSRAIDWVGTATLSVEAIDYAGNVSGATSTSITVNEPSSPILSYIFNESNVEISWDKPSSSIPIVGYSIEIVHPVNGTIQLGVIDTTKHLYKVDWGGTATFNVKAIDSNGNIGTAGSIDIVVQSLNSPSITSQVIDNNVLLRWSAPTLGSLPIKTYEIRKGSAYNTSSFQSFQDGSFVAFFETASSTYTYWVTAIDTAGNYGTPSSITAEVAQPPDYILHSNLEDTFSGTYKNAILRNNEIVFLANETETWEQHFVNNGFNTIEAQIVAGYPYYIQPTYNYSDTISNISSKQCTVSSTTGLSVGFLVRISGLPNEAENGIYTVASVDSSTTFTVTESISDASNISAIVKAGGSYTYTNDYGQILSNLTIQVNITSAAIAGNAELHFRIGVSNDDITYTWYTTDANNVFAASFRYVKVIIEASSDTGDDLITVSKISTVLSIKEITDSGTVTTSATGGTTVSFNKAFVDITSIQVSPNTTQNYIAVYDFVDVPSPTGFDIYLFDNTGTQISGEVSWIARGY